MVGNGFFDNAQFRLDLTKPIVYLIESLVYLLEPLIDNQELFRRAAARLLMSSRNSWN